ncbi:MAG TPA: type II secretion system protein [Noviherbaspirillum sp.]|nr:type II secretion system protein [Noviherbaspirillum sp.]
MGEVDMKRRKHSERGWTIVQIMTALLIAGIVAAIAVEVVIDMRCEADPARSICAGR